MSAAFKSMSDLVADSEDLLGRLGRSEIPQVLALVVPFARSVEQLQGRLRNRAKRLRRPETLTQPLAQDRLAQVIAAAFLISVSAAWLRHARKRQT